MQLTVAVVRTLYAFQLSKLTQLIEINQEQLKSKLPYEEVMVLVEEQAKLIEIKQQLAERRGIVVIR